MITPIPLLDDAELSKDLCLRKITGRNYLVSIVCVTRNAAAKLPGLIGSVRRLKQDNIEFIVVDGGSTDGTQDILRGHKELIDFWISRPDDGIYDAMNISLNYVQGKWILFLGADDYLLDGFADALVELKDPDTVYYGDVLFYGRHFVREYSDYYLTKLNICQQCMFYPVSVFDKYLFDLQYRVYADYHLNLRCWSDPQFKFRHINYLVSHFSEGGFSSRARDEAFERDRDMLFKKHLKRKSYYRYLNRTVGFGQMALRFLRKA